MLNENENPQFRESDESMQQPGAQENNTTPPENTAAPITEGEPQQMRPQDSGYQAYAAKSDPPAPFVQKKNSKSTGKIVALALCCSLIGGIIGAVVSLSLRPGSNKQTATGSSTIYEGNRENTVIDTVHVNTGEKMTAAEVYAANVNSTVGITTSITTNYWGYQTTSAASGSGFVLTPDGYILTNYHVIEDSNSITVTFYDGKSMEAQLVGYDSSNDIAVLKVDAESLSPVVLGDSNNMNVGDEVIAIGNPLGELTFTLTQGVVSALDRQVTTSTNATMTLMQTDCAINSGNSGGALFNLYGEVIGITNAKYSSSSNSDASIDNIGFAIPVNRIKSIVESIIEKGYISKPYIGVSVTDVSEETQRYGLPKGAAIYSVVEGSPAEKAGLQNNDIIVAVDGGAITGRNDLANIISQCEIGQVLTLNVYRSGNYIELTLTVGEQIQSSTEQKQPTNNDQYYPNPFG